MKDNYFVVVGKVVCKTFRSELGHIIVLRTKDDTEIYFVDVDYSIATNVRNGMTAEVWGHIVSKLGITYLVIDSLKEFKGDDY